VGVAEQAQGDQFRETRLVSLILLSNVLQSTVSLSHRFLLHLPGLLPAFICVTFAYDAPSHSD
jgi:hypothetical protein